MYIQTVLSNHILAQIPELKLIEKQCEDDHFAIIIGGLHIEWMNLRLA